MNKNSLKGSLGSGLGEAKKLEKQNIDIPVIKEAVQEIHKPDLLNLKGNVQFEGQEKETKGIFIKINKETS